MTAESPASGARFVGKNWGKHDTPPKNQNPDFQWLDFTRATIFYKPDFAIEDEQELKELKSRELAETFAKNWLCQKTKLARKNEPGEKARTKLTETFAENLEANFRNLTLPNKTQAVKKQTLPNEIACLPKPKLKTLKPILETWVNLKRNFLNQKPELIFRKQKLGKLPPLKMPDFIEPELLLKTQT